MPTKIRIEVLSVLLVFAALVAAVWWAISTFMPTVSDRLLGSIKETPPLGCVGQPYEFHDAAEAATTFQETVSPQCLMEAWEFLSAQTDKPAPTFDYWREACVQAKKMTNPDAVVAKLADMMDLTAQSFEERLQAMCCDPSRERGAKLGDIIAQQVDGFDDWQGVMVTVQNAECPGSADDSSPWSLFNKEFVGMAERGMALYARTAKQWLLTAAFSDAEKSADYAVRALQAAGSFEDYYEVAELLKGSNDARLVAIMGLTMIGMDRTAATFDERYACLQIAQRWYSRTEVSAMADRLAESAVSLKEWVFTHHYAARNSATERRAKAAIVEMAKTEKDWLVVAADVNLRRLAYDKLKALGDNQTPLAEATD